MPKKDVTKNNKKEKKENKHFFKDFKAELKKVIWPTPKQLVNNTVAVITIVLITAVIVFVLDVIFEKMNSYGIDKLKAVVETHNEQNENTNNEAEDAVNNIVDGENTDNSENTNNTDNTENSNDTNTQANNGENE